MSDDTPKTRLIWSRYYSAFVPAVPGPSLFDRVKAASGAIGGIAITGLLCGLMLGHGLTNPLLVAPMGASAVLLFAVPASPLAQPWPVLGGNVISALVGIFVAKSVPDPTLAAGLAVGSAIAVMSLLRCLHPPGGAVALSAALGVKGVASSYLFALVPVGVNTALLLGIAVLFHRLAGHNYPHVAAKAATPHDTSDPTPLIRAGPSDADIADALAATGETFDIEPADLRQILADAELRAAEREHGVVRCGTIMSRDVIHVAGDAPIDAAASLMRDRNVRVVPVLDDAGRVLGLIGALDLHGDALTTSAAAHRPFLVHEDTPLARLIGPFTSGAQHEAVVVDGDNRLLGLITQTDLIAALSVAPAQARPAPASR